MLLIDIKTKYNAVTIIKGIHSLLIQAHFCLEFRCKRMFFT